MQPCPKEAVFPALITTHTTRAAIVNTGRSPYFWVFLGR